MADKIKFGDYFLKSDIETESRCYQIRDWFIREGYVLDEILGHWRSAINEDWDVLRYTPSGLGWDYLANNQPTDNLLKVSDILGEVENSNSGIDLFSFSWWTEIKNENETKEIQQHLYFF